MVGKADKQSEGSKFLDSLWINGTTAKNISPLLFQKSRRKKPLWCTKPSKTIVG
jgi:hypothetical protein